MEIPNGIIKFFEMCIKQMSRFILSNAAKIGVICLAVCMMFVACGNGKDKDDDDGTTGDNRFTVRNTEEWNSALRKIQNAGDNHTCTIIIDGSFEIKGYHTSTPSFGSGKNIVVTFEGAGTVSLMNDSWGNLLRFRSEQTAIINGEDLIFKGRKGNESSLIRVEGGTLELKAGTLTGNSTSVNGAAVSNQGVVIMSGGAITNNSNNHCGGAIFGGTFTMTGGVISGNSAQYGGAVCYSKFTMEGGVISGNTASHRGGAVYIEVNDFFKKTGGTINGNDVTNPNNANGASPAGHAVFYFNRYIYYRNKTAGPNDNMDSGKEDEAGGWE